MTFNSIKFFFIVIAGLFITGFTLSIFRPELLEGTLGNVIGITFSTLIILGVLSNLFIFIRETSNKNEETKVKSLFKLKQLL